MKVTNYFVFRVLFEAGAAGGGETAWTETGVDDPAHLSIKKKVIDIFAHQKDRRVTSLRDVQLLVAPTTVIRGGTAALICFRDMQDAPLYSVKWYRGNHEFYRYTPMVEPDTKIFTIPGIFVDMSRSNGTQVVLRRMDLPLAGNFSCEVTADAPSFTTMVATKFINVVVLPQRDPVLKTEKDRYQPGEILRANCSSSPAKPPANLTIFINGDPVRSSETALHPADNGFLWPTIYTELKVTTELFHSGRLRVACVAAVYDVYRKSSNLDFFTPETDPRPERITLTGAASSYFHSWILLFLPFLLPVVFCQDYGTFDQFSNEVYYDDQSEATSPPVVGRGLKLD